MSSISSLFADENEKEIAVLGSSFIQNFLRSGDISKGFCVVSDKRVYFKGKCYYKVGKHFRATKEEKTIDLKDITGTGFSMTRNFLLFILFLLAVAWAIFFTMSIFMDTDALFAFCMGYVPLAIVGFLYYISHVKLFEISFAGGKISFKATDYSQQEITEFHKALRLAKDKSAITISDELRKYKELLDSDAITEDEYDSLKRRILD